MYRPYMARARHACLRAQKNVLHGIRLFFDDLGLLLDWPLRSVLERDRQLALRGHCSHPRLYFQPSSTHPPPTRPPTRGSGTCQGGRRAKADSAISEKITNVEPRYRGRRKGERGSDGHHWSSRTAGPRRSVGGENDDDSLLDCVAVLSKRTGETLLTPLTCSALERQDGTERTPRTHCLDTDLVRATYR